MTPGPVDRKIVRKRLALVEQSFGDVDAIANELRSAAATFVRRN